ncbi:MAG: PD-(D/E)XK nuclease family protein, partial [Synergistaceae bacterium]|nr:PD-(D/E)XK nuclease family protein [Synergistaceae bacterium]
MQTHSYNNGSDFKPIIHNIIREFSGHELRFIVPSRKDKRLFPGHEKLNIWTWQDIYEDIVPSGKRRRTLSPPDHLLILRRILEDALERHPDKVKSLPGLKRSGFLTVLSGDLRELLNEAVSPETLPLNPESDNPAEFLLPEIYSGYLRYLGDNSLLDSAQVYSAAYEAVLENQEWGKNLVVVFSGFLSFNHAQLELVQAIRDRCSDVVILKPETNMAGFHDADLQLGYSGRAAKSAGRILEIPSAEPGLEPEIIARTLALWSSGNWEAGGEFPGFDEIGLMIDEGREESFAEAFTRYGVPFNFKDGVTISATLPGKIISALRYLNSRNFPAYDTAIFLTQPCFAGSRFPVMRAYRAGCSGLESWKNYLTEKADDPSEKSREIFRTALTAIEAAEKFCKFLEGKNTPAKIMTEFDKFLNTPGLWLERDDDISDYPELDESMRFTASAIETVNDKVIALRELLPDLGSFKDYGLKGEDAYDFLEDWCRNSHVRAPLQLSDSVQIFAGTPPVLSSFPVWIMSGITQKSWSPNEKASPLLGNEERTRLNENGAFLPRTKEKAEQREALFRRLIMTGERLTVISRPLLDDEGRPVSESPFMPKFLHDMTDWKMSTLNSEGINILLDSDGFTFEGIDPAGNVARNVPCVKARSNTVAASDIQELLECPLLWYQRQVAKLYQPDSELVAPAEWGNMLHKYWETVWRIYREDMTAKGTRFTEIAKSEWGKLIEAGKDDQTYGKFHHLLSDKRLKRRLQAVAFRAERLAGVQGVILDSLHKNYEHEAILLEDEAQLQSGCFTG